MMCQKFHKSKFICSFFLLASRRFNKNRYFEEQIRWVPLGSVSTTITFLAGGTYFRKNR